MEQQLVSEFWWVRICVFSFSLYMMFTFAMKFFFGFFRLVTWLFGDFGFNGRIGNMFLRGLGFSQKYRVYSWQVVEWYIIKELVLSFRYQIIFFFVYLELYTIDVIIEGVEQGFSRLLIFRVVQLMISRFGLLLYQISDLLLIIFMVFTGQGFCRVFSFGMLNLDLLVVCEYRQEQLLFGIFRIIGNIVISSLVRFVSIRQEFCWEKIGIGDVFSFYVLQEKNRGGVRFIFCIYFRWVYVVYQYISEE